MEMEILMTPIKVSQKLNHSSSSILHDFSRNI